MHFTRSLFLTTCVLAIGCGGDDGSGDTGGDDSSSDEGATMTDATMTGATMTDATMTMTGTEESSSGGTGQTTEGSGTETGSTGADTSGSGTESGSGSETGAGECVANGQMECEEMEGCVFLNGGCTAIDSIECAKAPNENVCTLLPHCMWDARGNACVDV
jgi:hypothetical protein